LQFLAATVCVIRICTYTPIVQVASPCDTMPLVCASFSIAAQKRVKVEAAAPFLKPGNGLPHAMQPH
jgi:hypothetical protein